MELSPTSTPAGSTGTTRSSTAPCQSTPCRPGTVFWEWAAGHGAGSIFRYLDTYAGALETLTLLSARGHQIVIVTSKPDWAVHDTFAWLSDRRVPTREVHIVERKWLVDCDVYLDDAPHQVEALVRHRPEATVCRFVRPWNDPVSGSVDISGWQDFATLVRSLAE